MPLMRAPHLPLPSMAAALQAVQLLTIELTNDQIEQCLLNLVLAGRFQKLVFQGREFVLDVAHNPAATEYFAKRLRAEPVAGKTFAVVAMMSDKDRSASLANLAVLVDEWYLLDLADIPRAATPMALAENLAVFNLQVKAAGDIQQLMREILTHALPQDRILVFGSFFTVAAALALYAGGFTGFPRFSVRYTLKHRLIGAAVLAAIAVLVLPSFFKEKREYQVSTKSQIPTSPNVAAEEFKSPQPVPNIEPAPAPDTMFLPSESVAELPPSEITVSNTAVAATCSWCKFERINKTLFHPLPVPLHLHPPLCKQLPLCPLCR
ncbi:MAG: hypothetical protein U5M23_11950 [Marinagarivorans sp.]|nr:hypothetical protein [Marinagarivorans sp.]